ncbi:MAG: riboflavin biosynthesis protein RibD, partial [Rhodobacterales bacterium CG_4_10_14_0_8_um_filter_70_9]
LGARGVTRVLCEGGGRIAAALLRDGLADEIAWFSGGLALGADGGAAVGRLDLAALADAPRLTLASVETLGEDVLSVWRPA